VTRESVQATMKRGTLAWLTALLALSALAAVVTLVSRGAVRTPAHISH
jgi:hypothetical protein